MDIKLTTSALTIAILICMSEGLNMSSLLLVLATFHTLRLGHSMPVHTVRQKRAVFDIFPTMSSDYEKVGIGQPENKWNGVSLKYKSKIQFLRRMVGHLLTKQEHNKTTSRLKKNMKEVKYNRNRASEIEK